MPAMVRIIWRPHSTVCDQRRFPELAGEPGEVIRPGRDGVGQHQGEAAAVMADSPAWIQQTSPHFALFWPRWPKGCLLTSMRAAWLSIEGSKGTVREAQLLRNYVHKYLPRNVIAEHSGEVVAANGEVSGQCDIVIVDPSTPPFWDEEDYRIVPVECLYGVVEVKSTLDATELRKAWKQIARVKALPKTAYYPDPQPRTRTIYGRDWPYIPTVGMVFAYDGVRLETLSEEFEQLADQHAPEHRPDSVWVLNKGFINWISPKNGKLDPGPEPDAGYIAAQANARAGADGQDSSFTRTLRDCLDAAFQDRRLHGKPAVGHSERMPA